MELETLHNLDEVGYRNLDQRSYEGERDLHHLRSDSSPGQHRCQRDVQLVVHH